MGWQLLAYEWGSGVRNYGKGHHQEELARNPEFWRPVLYEERDLCLSTSLLFGDITISVVGLAVPCL